MRKMVLSYKNRLAVFAYVDDVVLISKSHNNIRSLFTRLEEKAKNVGLQVNEEKIEYIVMAVFPYLKIGRYEFSRAKQVKYLGSILTKKKMRLTKK